MNTNEIPPGIDERFLLAIEMRDVAQGAQAERDAITNPTADAVRAALKGTAERQKISSFLYTAAAMATLVGPTRKDLGRNPVFSRDVQELDGFKIGFMKDGVFERLCKNIGLDAGTSEAILMQATRPTEPHVHQAGDSAFLPLGAPHGYPNSRGSTYIGEYRPDASELELNRLPAIQGIPFRIPPGMVHFFAPEKDACFTALAFVSPKIQRESGNFDIAHLPGHTLSLDADKAILRAPSI